MNLPPKGLIGKLASAGEQASARARETVEEAELKRDLARAYGDLGRAAFGLIERGALAEQAFSHTSEEIRALERRIAAIASEGRDGS